MPLAPFWNRAGCPPFDNRQLTIDNSSMPELPEVETIARQLRKAIVGQRVVRAELLRKDVLRGNHKIFSRTLCGREIVDVQRRAKRLIVLLRPEAQLIFHLGMSGRILVVEKHTPVEKHTHLRLSLGKKGMELRFVDPRRFGGIWLVTDGQQATGRGMGAVGPEPLTLRISDFRVILHRRTQIKSLLMDQRRIAGLGNIYCCEALHRAGIHPLTPAHSIDALPAARLLREIKSVLRHAIQFEGSTYMNYRGANGEPGSFQRYHRVYQRENEPCPACQTPIARIVTSGRSTFFCPKCQALAS